MRTIQLMKQQDLKLYPSQHDNTHILLRNQDLFINPDFITLIDLYESNRFSEIPKTKFPVENHRYHVFVNRFYTREELEVLEIYARWIDNEVSGKVYIHLPTNMPDLKISFLDHFKNVRNVRIDTWNSEFAFLFFVDNGWGAKAFTPNRNTYIKLFWISEGMELSFLSRHRRY